jgi:hypothetical protein
VHFHILTLEFLHILSSGVSFFTHMRASITEFLNVCLKARQQPGSRTGQVRSLSSSEHGVKVALDAIHWCTYFPVDFLVALLRMLMVLLAGVAHPRIFLNFMTCGP